MKLKENKSLKNLFLFLTICVLSGLGLTAMGQTKVEFKSTGNTTWTVPPGVSQITIHGIGGGGRGGSASQYAGAGGGGGGAYDVNTVSVTPGEVIYIHVANGGTSASAPNGEASTASKTLGGYDLLNANGGHVGESASSDKGGISCSKCASGAGGAGGAASGRSGSIAGGRGGNGNGSDYKGGGGGGAAGPGFTPATDVATALNGRNGFDYDGSNNGDGGKGGTTGLDHGGYSGNSYGGGGGGAMTGTSVSYAGADGAQGIVWITYYVNNAVNVTFNANMPQNDNNMNNAIPANGSINYGDAYGSILNWRDASYQTARRGYTFSGWNTAADGTGTEITATSVAGTSDVVLYAQWTPFTMTVTFDVNGGTWATQPNPNPFQVTYGETYSSKTGWDWQVPTKTGYLFQGWKLDGGSTYFGPDSKVNQIANHKLVAEWVAEESLPSAKTVCYEDVVSLCAPSGYSGYTWTPAAGLSDATSQCPTLTAANMTSASVQYKCNYTSGSVFNGDFNLGNQGFSSDYDFVTDASDVNNELQPERKISTTTCWHNVHNSLDTACTLKSYENDGGMFLAVNGGKFPNEVVWEQTVTVAKNTKYRISVQCAAASPDGDAAPAKLMFFVNGAKVSTDTTKVASHAWQEMFVEWQNTDAVFATIAIKDFTEATGGNDFAIDHVVVEAIDGLGKEYTVDVTRRDQFNPGAIATTGQTRNYGTGTNNAIGSTTAATGGDNTISYQWYQNGTEISGATGATYTPTVTEPGTYVFTRKAKDGTCVELTASTGSWTLTINNVTVSIDTVKGAKAFCAGGSTTLTAEATAAQGTISYEWSNGATTASTTVSAAGDYTVTASVTVGGETTTDTKTVRVTVYDAPSFTVTTTPESCKGHDGKAKVSLDDVTYTWSNGDDNQEPDTLTSLANGGVYSVTVTDANGCQASQNVTITLNNTLAIEDITGPVVCTGTEFTIFPDDAPEGTTYSWPAPDAISGISGLTAGENQPSINGTLVADPTIITTPTPVAYTVTPKNGVCTGNAMDVTITVTTIVNPGVTITIPREMTKCAGTEVEIPAEFVNSVAPHSVKWVLKGTTDTITHANLTVNKDTLRLTLPETCSAEYSYLVFDADNSGCVANDGCVITVNSGTWSVPANITVDIPCEASAATPAATLLPTVTDNCGKPVTLTLKTIKRYLDASYLVMHVDYIYTATACDGSTKEWRYIYNIKDEAAPTMKADAEWPDDITGVNACKNNPDLTGLLTDAQVKDLYEDCVAITVVGSDVTTGNDQAWTVTRTYTIKDAHGNEITPAPTMSVSGGDATKPEIACVADQNVYTDADQDYATLTFDDPVPTDNCSTPTYAITYSPAAPTDASSTNASGKYPIGETVVTYTATDAAGNTASCTFTVTVEDNQLPCIGCDPTATDPTDPTAGVSCSSITGNTGNVIVPMDLDVTTYTHGNDNWNVTASDNDGIASLTYVLVGATTLTTPATTLNGQTFNKGITKVIWTATDNANNSVSCSFTVTVVDEQKPAITAPEDIEVHSYAEKPDAYADLDEFLAAGGAVSDNDEIDPDSFRSTEVSDGKTCPETFTRTYFISDISGNEASAVQLVVVNDNVAPTFDAPEDVVICRVAPDGTIDANTTLTGEPSNLADNNSAVEDLDMSFVDLDTLPADNHDMRVIRRQWKVVDECENATTKIQNISVYPAVAVENTNFKCPDDIDETLPFGQCEMEINIGVATYTDLFDQTLTLTNNAPADNIYPEGTTIVTWTLTDECGFSISCDQTITVTFPECPVAVDADGNEYESVRIGCDCWTKRNLESLTYSDGTEIPGVYNYVSEVYPNENDNVATFGRLYDWASVINDGEDNLYGHVQGICPEGWYLPTRAKYDELNGYGVSALKAPEYWLDGGGSNTTGFTSLPGGFYDGSIDRYMNLMGEAYYWSTSKVDGEWTPVPCSIRYICNQIIDATYLEGLGYSVRCIKEKEFRCGDIVKDVDNNTYNTIKIGDQCWTKENLKTTKYADGTAIALGGVSSTAPCRYYPDGDASNVETFGYLYNWAAAMNGSSSSNAVPSGVQGICPKGWHIPSNAEWYQLSDFVSSISDYVCGDNPEYIAKSLAAATEWGTWTGFDCLVGGDLPSNNATGFTILPAGHFEAGGEYYSYFRRNTGFWSSTLKNSDEAYNAYFFYGSAQFNHYESNLRNGSSVRCLRDQVSPAPAPVFECGTSTISDVDGNTYNTVKIGDQCWMKENLRTSTTTGNTYHANNNASNDETYGLLYDWAAVMQGSSSSEANPSGVQGICPAGWHVPSNAEWTQLTDYVSSKSEYQCGGADYIANALSAATGWNSNTSEGCNAGSISTTRNLTGFSAVPAGVHLGNINDSYFGNNAYFWSAAQYRSGFAYYCYLDYSEASVYHSRRAMGHGLSVRCLKD
ncbi:MAG: HYR domain-containing protein [Bacteroidales bacterium]|nr:HYR domain-containing protein [Bacteroidales bacterium]